MRKATLVVEEKMMMFVVFPWFVTRLVNWSKSLILISCTSCNCGSIPHLIIFSINEGRIFEGVREQNSLMMIEQLMRRILDWNFAVFESFHVWRHDVCLEIHSPVASLVNRGMQGSLFMSLSCCAVHIVFEVSLYGEIIAKVLSSFGKIWLELMLISNPSFVVSAINNLEKPSLTMGMMMW